MHQRLGIVWNKIVANYEHLGPFRPVLWAHWEAQAEVLGPVAARWRLARLLWTALAAGMLLWLLLELRIRPAPALVTAALAMWNPYRNEIWTSLTLSEGVAMPYALLGLVCALRAARSSRAWAWDVAGTLSVLAALGCKNTFAALVPAQILLRLDPDGRSLREGWRRHGRRACLLGLTLLLPVVHFIVFKLNWRPGQYETGGLSWAQLGRMLRVIRGAIGADFVGPGLVLAAVAVLVHASTAVPTASPADGHASASPGAALRQRLRFLWAGYPAACRAGFLLLLCGIGIYLPLGAVSGRYSMPAVWGADLWIAALLSTLAEAPASFWRRIAHAFLGAGLVAVAAVNLGRQDRFAARAGMLWQALEFVEQRVPPGASVGWVAGPDLNVEEGIHFSWHLHARGRKDITVRLLDSHGRPQPRREVPQTTDVAPALFLTGALAPPPGGRWQLLREFGASYWAGRRHYRCSLWTKGGQEALPLERPGRR
jgi:hypothetical protein